MQITMYSRSYPVADAPVSLSLVPDPAGQRHTFAAGGRVYEAGRREVRVVVHDDAKPDLLKNLLCWAGGKGPIQSTAKEVFDPAAARTSVRLNFQRRLGRRLVDAGSLERAVRRGTGRMRLPRRVDGRRLRPGRYLMLAKVAGCAASKLPFTVVRG